jgi:hypothetical protein
MRSPPPPLRGFFILVRGDSDALSVVELRLDAEDQVIDRRAIPYPYPQRLDAVDTIEKLIARLDKAHHEAEWDLWMAVAKDGKTRLKFVIERV